MTAPHVGPGHTVAGRYTVRAMLGFSGEAATYHATAATGHEVVLKLFDPAVGQRADVMSRLGQVNSAIAQLPHEFVVPVADSGYDMATSAPFVVSEFVKLPSLEAMVRQGPLPVATVAKILEGLARVLDACHARQLSHLALKPTNLFVSAAPNFSVRVCDFGASVVRSTSPTHEAYAKSAPWWAPEQLQPAAVLGAPADVFSAALIAFYALTGRSFWGSCQSNPPDLATWQVEVMGPRLGAAQRASMLGVQLPSSVDAVFARAWSVQQAERPQSVSELAQALASASGGAYRSDYGGGAAPAVTMALPEHDAYPMMAAMGATPAPKGATVAALPAYPGSAGPSQGPSAGPAVPTPAMPTPAMPTPGLPPMAPAAPPKRGSAAPILIGVGAAVVVAAVVAAVVVKARSSDGSASAQPVAVAAPSSAPNPSTSSETPPEPVASDVPAVAAPGESGEAAPPEAPADKVVLTLVCKPACDELLVDNEKLPSAGEKTTADVLLGKHTVEARSAGYAPYKETIDVDKALEKEVKLTRLVAPPSSLPATPPPRTVPPVSTSRKPPCKPSILRKCP